MKKVFKKFLFPILTVILFFLLMSFNKSYSQQYCPCDTVPYICSGPNWVNNCGPGTDVINNTVGILPVILFPGICGSQPDTVKACGPITVFRGQGSNDSISTVVTSMLLSGNFYWRQSFQYIPVYIRAGAGQGVGPRPLQASTGRITKTSSTTANSYFDLFFEIQIINTQHRLPGPLPDTIFLYNDVAKRFQALNIEGVPPPCPTQYSGPQGCIDLFFGTTNTVAALLGNANHSLPVELSSFNSIINERDVTLNWITSSEENNSGFDIERSIVNGEWSKISYINGQGNSNVAHNYSFVDKNLSSGRYEYRLKQIDYNGNFKYFNLQNEVVIGIPAKFSLYQNYPNPFNPTTKINYDISKDGIVSLKLYDNSGREVKTLLNEFKSAGYYNIELNATDLSSGVYFYRLESDNKFAVKRMILLK